MSSMTVSSMTVSMLNFTDTSSIAGRIVQKVAVSTTSYSCATSVTFTQAPTLVSSFTLLNSNSYVRVTLSGQLGSFNSLYYQANAYVTVYRDSTNLGSTDDGFISALGDTILIYPNIVEVAALNPVGISFVDRPGDTANHVYKVFYRTSFSGNTMVCFPYAATGYLLLEEVSQ